MSSIYINVFVLSISGYVDVSTLAFVWQVQVGTRKQVGCNFSQPQNYFGTGPLRSAVDLTKIIRTSENS